MFIFIPRKAGRASGEAGYTIIEIVVVILIVGILATFAITKYLNYLDENKVAHAITDIRWLENKITAYQLEQGLPDSLGNLSGGPFIDPWGNPYEYLNVVNAGPGQVRKDRNLVPLNSDYDLYSKGADGDSRLPLTAHASQDDVVRANNGGFVGLASKY